MELTILTKKLALSIAITFAGTLVLTSSAYAGPRRYKDFDRDGVVNWLDKCPKAAETYNGFHDKDGCPDRIPKKYFPKRRWYKKKIYKHIKKEKLKAIHKSQGKAKPKAIHKTKPKAKRHHKKVIIKKVKSEPGTKVIIKPKHKKGPQKKVRVKKQIKREKNKKR